ncbi:MAG TPA: IS5 family transposase [Ktedonobacteraceae bacterium]
MSKRYPSDLSDAEWMCLQRYLPPMPKRGRPATHSLRMIFNAIFYVLRTGCPWRYLPTNFPPWQTVFYHFRRLRLKGIWTLLLRALHRAERERQGRNPHPSAAILDAQSVKTVEESAGISGFDAHKRVKGRKRHILVDTLGIPLSIYVTEADVHDTRGARCLLAGLKYFVPRLVKIWADAAYRGQELAAWCKTTGEWDLEVVERTPDARGFSVVPKRWVVERTFGWISRNRRMSKDYERKVQTSETLIQVVVVRLLLARVGCMN